MNKIEEVSKDIGKKAINFTEEISNFIFTSRYSRYNEKLKEEEKHGKKQLIDCKIYLKNILSY